MLTRGIVVRFLAGFAAGLLVRLALRAVVPETVGNNIALLVMLTIVIVRVEPDVSMSRHMWMVRIGRAALAAIVVAAAFRILDATPRLIAWLLEGAR